MSMKKQLTNEHSNDFERLKRQTTEAESLRHKIKRRKVVPPSKITIFFGNTKFYKKNDVQQQMFIEDTVLFIAKGYEALSTIESLWFRHFVMRQGPKVAPWHVFKSETTCDSSYSCNAC